MTQGVERLWLTRLILLHCAHHSTELGYGTCQQYVNAYRALEMRQRMGLSAVVAVAFLTWQRIVWQQGASPCSSFSCMMINHTTFQLAACTQSLAWLLHSPEAHQSTQHNMHKLTLQASCRSVFGTSRNLFQGLHSDGRQTRHLLPSIPRIATIPQKGNQPVGMPQACREPLQ